VRIEADFPKDRAGKYRWQVIVDGKVFAESKLRYSRKRDALRALRQAAALTQATWTFRR